MARPATARARGLLHPGRAGRVWAWRRQVWWVIGPPHGGRGGGEGTHARAPVGGHGRGPCCRRCRVAKGVRLVRVAGWGYPLRYQAAGAGVGGQGGCHCRLP
jgi:hypothetical protein